MTLVGRTPPYHPSPLAAEIIHPATEELSGLDKLSHVAPTNLDNNRGPNPGDQAGSDGQPHSGSTTSNPQPSGSSSAGSTSFTRTPKRPNTQSQSNSRSRPWPGETVHSWVDPTDTAGKWTNEVLDARDDIKWTIQAANASGLLERISRFVPGLVGIVTARRWKTVVTIVKASFIEPGEGAPAGVASYSKILENSLLVAGLAANLAEQSKKIDAVIHSQDSNVLKAAGISSIVSTAAQRTLMGAVAGGPKLMYSTAEAIYIAGSVVTGRSIEESINSQPVQTLQRAKRYVDTGFKWVTDADNQIWLVHKVIL